MFETGEHEKQWATQFTKHIMVDHNPFQKYKNASSMHNLNHHIITIVKPDDGTGTINLCILFAHLYFYKHGKSIMFCRSYSFG